MMKNFILESNKLSPEFEQNIIYGNEIKYWYLSYTDSQNNLIYMSAYKRREEYLWFFQLK